MNVNIHPYKGYLNTNFHFYVRGEESIAYKVIPVNASDKEPILEGVITAYSPFSILIPQPGEYNVVFSDGNSSKIYVEDGYKFGGSKFKNAFIFDNTPWCFIIMNDRTYFYNRDSGYGYVETLSPTNIEIISENHILLSNTTHAEITLYNLQEQQPEICFENVKFFNDEILIWSEEKTFIFYSLLKKKVIKRKDIHKYYLDNNNNILYFEEDNKFKKCSLRDELIEEIVVESEGTFITLIDYLFAVFFDDKNKKLLLYDIFNPENIKELAIESHIASINGEVLINLDDRRTSLNLLNMKLFIAPEAKIESKYSEFIFYPCKWDIFYMQRDVAYFKDINDFRVDEKITLKCIGSDLNITFSKFNNKVFKDDTRFVIFNNTDSFVKSKDYSGSGYTTGAEILIHNNNVIAHKDGFLYRLSRNAYWDGKKEHNYDFSQFEKYGIIKNKDTEFYESLFYNIKDKNLSFEYNPTEYIELGNSAIFPTGKVVLDKSSIRKFSQRIKYTSESLMYGLLMEDNLPYIIWFDGDTEKKQRILTDIFDNSSFNNVLLSENGEQILYRNKNKVEIRNVLTGECTTFDNLSYVQQINGIRPCFEKIGSLQPTIIDPATGQTLDVKLLSKFSFISPNGRFYADTILDKYVEYYYLDSNLIISKEDYIQLSKDLMFPDKDTCSKERWQSIKQKRIDFIKSHFDFLNSQYPRVFTNPLQEDKWLDSAIDEQNNLGVDYFLSRVIARRGIAKIRQISDDTEVAKIDLGKPLSYLNYVSFSYDSRYVSIAGYRDFSHGLFLIYDIENRQMICKFDTNRAVWTTAFSIKGAVAAYTSNPYFIFFSDFAKAGIVNDLKEHSTLGKSFLTFSPNGDLLALSNRGYISKYDINGDERPSWGHQPTTLVEIRKTEAIEDIKITFNDLSDEGIADSSKAKSVASVSFSNDNTRLMMVGKDGVVIIRNLHLEDYAGE